MSPSRRSTASSHQLLNWQVDLADHHPVVILIEHVAHLPDDVMDALDTGGVNVIELVERPRTGRGVGVGRLVAELLVLQQQPDHVHPKAVDAAIQPEAHIIERGLQHFRVAEVKLRLAFVELVHVELAARASRSDVEVGSI